VLAPFRHLPNSLDLQGAFAKLSRSGFAGQHLDETLRHLTATTGQLLKVERVSLWGLTTQRQILECIDLYELSHHRHSRSVTRHATHYPEYFRALGQGEPIVADDAMKHPAAQELASDYLLLNGISAFINSPIHADGELQGILCIERVGPHSAWTSVQRLFAHGVASLVSLALLQHQLLSREEELRDANSLRHALFNGARDAILISDAQTGHILAANPEAERLFGRTLQQLLGVLQSDLYAGREQQETRDLLRQVASTDHGDAVRSEVLADNGRLIPVEISGQVVQLDKGREVIVHGVFRPPEAETKAPDQRATKVGR
jgi:PAS domain S-box-containing protein